MQLRDYLKLVDKHPEAFANEIGVSRRTVYRYLSGERPKFAQIIRIKKATNGAVTASDWETLAEGNFQSVAAVA